MLEAGHREMQVDRRVEMTLPHVFSGSTDRQFYSCSLFGLKGLKLRFLSFNEINQSTEAVVPVVGLYIPV